MVAFTVALAWPVPGAAALAPQVKGVHIVTFINIVIVVSVTGAGMAEGGAVACGVVWDGGRCGLFGWWHLLVCSERCAGTLVRAGTQTHTHARAPTTGRPARPQQFLISGMTLRTDELKAVLTRRNALGSVWGLVAIVGVTPLLAFAVRDLPLSPPEYATGLALFCIMPTTLGVGISLVTSAKVRRALGALRRRHRVARGAARVSA
jgi:hypothetical protein